MVFSFEDTTMKRQKDCWATTWHCLWLAKGILSEGFEKEPKSVKWQCIAKMVMYHDFVQYAKILKNAKYPPEI